MYSMSSASIDIAKFVASFPGNPYKFQILLLLLILLVKPTLAADSSIGSSSDVWAALVANIAPLLILVGEKHVKAYFKVMCRTSHYLLYAAGPIGLITAITTLVRLNGSRSVKRIIGRQYESRGEVLADVTSVSSGMVRFELRGGVLEQTTTPDEEDEAYFYIRKNIRGNAQKVIEWFESRIGFGGIAIGNAVAWWTIVGSFRAEVSKGDMNPVDKARTAARMFMNQLERSDEEIPGCDSSLELCAAWQNVSLPLTAATDTDNGFKEAGRWIITIVCFLGYIGIIIANWHLQHDIQNTILVCVGLATSTFGAYWAARLVDRASDELVIDISALEVNSAGYYSGNIPWGVTLPFCPKTIVCSADSQRASQSALLASLTNVSVIVMSIGYIALYLGLRTSEWWASLALLFTSAVASIARVFLVSDNLELTDSLSTRDANSDKTTWPHEFTTNYTRYTYMPTAPVAPTSTSSTSTPSTSNIQTSHNINPDPICAPVIVGPTYHTLAIHYKGISSKRLFSPPSGQNRQNIHALRLSLVVNGLYLVLQLRKQGLIPVEFTIPEFVNHQRPTFDARILFSDIICHDGVWRQPFEVFIKEELFNSSEPDVLMVYLSSWFRRATAIRDGDQATGNTDKSAGPNAKQIANLNISRIGRDRLFSPTISMWENTKRQLGGATDRFSQEILPGDYFWMTAKICFVYFLHEPSARLEQLAVDLTPGQTVNHQAAYSLSPMEAEIFIQCLKEIGLVVDAPPENSRKVEVDIHNRVKEFPSLIHINRSNGVEDLV